MEYLSPPRFDTFNESRRFKSLSLDEPLLGRGTTQPNKATNLIRPARHDMVADSVTKSAVDSDIFLSLMFPGFTGNRFKVCPHLQAASVA